MFLTPLILHHFLSHAYQSDVCMVISGSWLHYFYASYSLYANCLPNLTSPISLVACHPIQVAFICEKLEIVICWFEYCVMSKHCVAGIRKQLVH